MLKRAAAVVLLLTLQSAAKTAFVLKTYDHEKKLVELKSVLAPSFIVYQESGPIELRTHEVVNCNIKARTRKMILEGKEERLTETILECGDRKFVIRGVSFGE